MSSHKVQFADLALQDLTEIAQFTEEQWGSEQADAYLEMLCQRIDSLGVFPHLGRQAPGFTRSTHIVAVRQHLILYAISNETVTILRVVHQRADWSDLIST